MADPVLVAPAKSKMYQLPVSFFFRVEFDPDGKDGLQATGEDYDVGFQEVSGLNSSIETETFQEGGENRFSHRFPKPPTYQNLVLKRGMLVSSILIAWFKDAIVSFIFKPITVTVTLLDSKKEPLETWKFINAYPVKWNIDSFNAQDGKLAIETIELSYQYYERLATKKSPEPREPSVALKPAKTV